MSDESETILGSVTASSPGGGGAVGVGGLCDLGELRELREDEWPVVDKFGLDKVDGPVVEKVNEDAVLRMKMGAKVGEMRDGILKEAGVGGIFAKKVVGGVLGEVLSGLDGDVVSPININSKDGKRYGKVGASYNCGVEGGDVVGRFDVEGVDEDEEAKEFAGEVDLDVDRALAAAGLVVSGPGCGVVSVLPGEAPSKIVPLPGRAIRSDSEFVEVEEDVYLARPKKILDTSPAVSRVQLDAVLDKSVSKLQETVALVREAGGLSGNDEIAPVSVAPDGNDLNGRGGLEVSEKSDVRAAVAGGEVDSANADLLARRAPMSVSPPAFSLPGRGEGLGEGVELDGDKPKRVKREKSVKKSLSEAMIGVASGIAPGEGGKAKRAIVAATEVGEFVPDRAVQAKKPESLSEFVNSLFKDAILECADCVDEVVKDLGPNTRMAKDAQAVLKLILAKSAHSSGRAQHAVMFGKMVRAFRDEVEKKKEKKDTEKGILELLEEKRNAVRMASLASPEALSSTPAINDVVKSGGGK